MGQEVSSFQQGQSHHLMGPNFVGFEEQALLVNSQTASTSNSDSLVLGRLCIPAMARLFSQACPTKRQTYGYVGGISPLECRPKMHVQPA